MNYPSAKANATEQKEQRKSLRNNMTSAEALLWRALKGRGTGGMKFRRQQGVGPFILDFYCPEHRLGIETDGSSHDYKYEYNEKRTEYLRSQGIRLLRFSNQQVFTSMQGVLAEIAREVNRDTDITP
jgi:very-short-patch-repair endonuclease